MVDLLWCSSIPLHMNGLFMKSIPGIPTDKELSTLRKKVHLLEEERDAALLKLENKDTEEEHSEAKKSAGLCHDIPCFIIINEIESGIILSVNNAYCELVSFSSEELTGKTFPELGIIDAKDWNKLQKRLKTSQKLATIETRFKTKTGELKSVLFSSKIIEHNGNTCLLISGVDLTPHKRALEARVRSMGLYRELVQHASSAIIRWKRNGTIIFFNDYAQSFFGYTKEEVIGKNIGLILPLSESNSLNRTKIADDIAAHPERYQKNINGIICRDGRRVWMIWTNRPIFDETGEIAEILSIGSDITGLMQAEKALEENARLDAFRVVLNDSLRQIGDPREIQTEASRVLGEHLQANRVFYAEIENESAVVFLDYHKDVASLAGRYLCADYGPTAKEELMSGRTLVVDDVSVDSRLTEIDRAVNAELEVGAYILVPLIKEGMPVAGFGVHQKQPREWRKAEISLIEETAERTWAAVERARAERDLLLAKEAAEEATRAKSEFLANMSHEIRTPMTVFMVALEHLLQLDKNPERRHLLEMADKSANRLRALLDDILDLSRIEARRVALEKDPFYLPTCVRDAVEMFSLSAQEKNLRLETYIAPGTPEVVIGDSARLGQVLTNLVGNAVKFTEAGAVRVSVMPRGDFLEFSIADTGPGIPEDKCHLLFKSFSQVDSSFTRQHGGSGLGLAISKGLVELMGGEISVKSQFGKGSVFTFSLPVQEAEAKKSTVRTEALPTPCDEKGVEVRILLTEDEPMIREMVIMMLSRRGWHIETAENGRQAVDKMEKGDFNILLMDLQMPEMNGLEATRMIRELEAEKAKRSCIIGLTAHARREIRDECIKGGMDRVLIKPLKMNTLFSAIESCMVELSALYPE